jgi:tRNA A58 N-methylase Trm61
VNQPSTLRRGPLQPGDRVQITDRKGRRHTLWLEPGKIFHTHHGQVAHDDLIDQPEGSVVTSSSGSTYLALRPTLADVTLSMPRGATVVYPKDATAILGAADVGAGLTVVEAGAGSGALSMWLLRAVGEHGQVHSFERRADFADVAARNVERYFGHRPGHWTLTVGDLVEHLPQHHRPGSVDRVVLDMLAPWECLGAVADALVPGVCCASTSPPPPSSPGSSRQRATASASRSRPRPRPCSARGTWRASRFVPTTEWSGTPDSSSRRAGSPQAPVRRCGRGDPHRARSTVVSPLKPGSVDTDAHVEVEVAT